MTTKPTAKAGGAISNHNETVASELRVRTAVDRHLEVGMASDFPLRTGSEESFRLVHSFLQESGYYQGPGTVHGRLGGNHRRVGQASRTARSGCAARSRTANSHAG